jgi:hypothetical protein
MCLHCKIILDESAELRRATISFRISDRQHGTTRFTLEALSLNFIFDGFLENLTKITRD